MKAVPFSSSILVGQAVRVVNEVDRGCEVSNLVIPDPYLGGCASAVSFSSALQTGRLRAKGLVDNVELDTLFMALQGRTIMVGRLCSAFLKPERMESDSVLTQVAEVDTPKN